MSIEVNSILNYLKELKFEYEYHGKNEFSITHYSSVKNLSNNCITWVKNESYYEEHLFDNISDMLVVVNSDIDITKFNSDNIGVIICNNPKEIFFTILDKFFEQEKFIPAISSTSVVETKNIGRNVYIGNNCYIGKNVKIGDDVIIKNNVSIEGNVEIGMNTVIHSGVVIGTDGYGYFKNGDGKNVKVPHYGGVKIGSDVEIGANTCIDRGTLDDTLIGDNVKIDNLCHIAHNVIIEDNCNVIALTMLGGSVILKENAYVAPSASIKNQVIIGENSLVGLGAVVVKDVGKNKVVAGVPAKVLRDNNEK